MVNGFQSVWTRTSGFQIATLLSLLPFSSAVAQNSVLTFHNDNARTGQMVREGILTPANVNASTFGKLFTVAVDGRVDAQPLYVPSLNIASHAHNVVYAATEHDSVYAFDADNGTEFWKVSLLKSGETPSDDRGCDQVTPEIGVTSTPVIDLTVGAHGTIYLVAMSKDHAGNYHHRIHALDITTGAEELGGPVDIQASVPGTGPVSSNGTVTFQAAEYKDRAGLLLVNGLVYTSWGSHCDNGLYTGWIMAYDRLTLHQTAVLNVAPNGSEGALWNSGAGPAADSQGTIFAALGNGTFDTTLNGQGFPSRGDFGNAFIKVITSNGHLSITDYWTMDNTTNESNGDVDLGSGGFMLLPDMTDSKGNTRHLAVGAGKDGNMYIADRDNMGKFDANANATIYQSLSGALSGGVWGTPAYFNNTIYYGPIYSDLKAFSLTQARVSSNPTSVTNGSFTYPGILPSVSAYITKNAIVWGVENSSPAVLHAFDANNLGREFYNSNQAGSGRDQFGPGNKYIVPTIANGKVFVGTTNSVAVFGLLHLSQPAIPDGDFMLLNHASNLYLDDPAGSTTVGTQMVQWRYTGNPTQHWFFAYQGNGYYTIQNVYSGFYMTDLFASKALPTRLEQHSAFNDDTELWSLTPSSGGFIIRNKSTGYVMDDPGGTTALGTGINLWPQNGYANQIWSIQ